jgi:hypothetical protein
VTGSQALYVVKHASTLSPCFRFDLACLPKRVTCVVVLPLSLIPPWKYAFLIDSKRFSLHTPVRDTMAQIV